MERKIYTKIVSDLKEKMVFVVGPRQVGKTWLAKKIMEGYKNPIYLNFDNGEHREIIKKQAWLTDVDLIVFDEIHKMSGWKNYLKGVYDTKPESTHLLVTGSARMDTFKNVGDSLAGRFYVHHLLPFTLAELRGLNFADRSLLLFERSGFPEPLFAESKESADRWRSLYTDSLIGQDMIEFQEIGKLNIVKQIYELLKTKVGSPLSYNSIARDLGVSSLTVKKYIEIMEALYVVFIIKPYTRKISRSILKEPKVYFFDYGVIADKGARFENFTAVSLYKHAVLKKDLLGKAFTLGYLRTKEGKEVDFALADEQNNLLEIIEAKFSESKASETLEYFSTKYNVKSTQIVYDLKMERVSEKGVHIVKAEKYLETLEPDYA